MDVLSVFDLFSVSFTAIPPGLISGIGLITSSTFLEIKVESFSIAVPGTLIELPVLIVLSTLFTGMPAKLLLVESALFTFSNILISADELIFSFSKTPLSSFDFLSENDSALTVVPSPYTLIPCGVFGSRSLLSETPSPSVSLLNNSILFFK